jgi:hypothetical protein
MFYLIESASPAGWGAGRWRSLFIASPRSFMVLFFRRLYGLRAEGVAGVYGRGGGARRWEGHLR